MLIQGHFTLKTPLSHISESISTGSLLNERPIVQSNGDLVDVFCYNGNAWRGQIRDLCALYLIDALSIKELSTEKHNFLFSGGKIGGPSKFNLENMKKHFALLPHFALLGGCLDNMMLPGKTAVFDCLPICQESITELPKRLHHQAVENTYKRMTIEREFTRMDDSKNMRLNQSLVLDECNEKEAVQMRMGGELLNSGVELFSRILLNNASELELGALCSALVKFANYSFIGGQHNKGHGLVDLIYSLDNEPFFSVVDMKPVLSTSFKQHLALYDTHLNEHKTDILELLA